MIDSMERSDSNDVIHMDIMDISSSPKKETKEEEAVVEGERKESSTVNKDESNRDQSNFFVVASSTASAAQRKFEKEANSLVGRGMESIPHRTNSENRRWMSVGGSTMKSLHVGLGEASECIRQEEEGGNKYVSLRKRNSAKRRNRISQLESSSALYHQSGTKGIIMPYNRVQWDILLLFLIFLVLLLTPFELTFLNDDISTKDAAIRNKKRQGLFYINRFIDFCFVIDIILAFNTAYWKFERGWITKRSKIAMHYIKTWFFYDLIAVIPYDMIELQVAYVRLIRVFKLLRLLRLVKQPRIMSNLAKHITLRRSQQAIIQYIVLLLCLVHWSACLLQAVSSQVLSNCDTKNNPLRFPHETGDDDCPRTFLNYVWNNGVWARYAQAIAWGTGTLFGEIVASNNTAETILASAVGLVGVIFISILVGDLANLFSGSDPADNEFTTSFDYLNRYLDSIAMPHIMRKKLREFMLLSEEVFRENYNKSLIHRLSPEMEAILARQSLRAVVERVPFYVFALSHGAGLRIGSIVRVWRHHSVDGWMHASKRRARWATVTHVHKDSAYVTIEYHDDESSDALNTNKIGAGRRRSSTDILNLLNKKPTTPIINNKSYDFPPTHFCDDGVFAHESSQEVFDDEIKPKQERILITRIASQSLDTHNHVVRHARLLYERDHFVRDMARLFRLQLYLAYEDVITRDLSMSDSMYAIHAGRIALFGRSCRHVLRLELLGLHDVFGDDITMNLVGRKQKLTRHYAAKTLSNVFVLVLDGDAFFQAIQASGAKLFYQYCKYYGSWLLLKRSVLAALRANTLKNLFSPDWKAVSPTAISLSSSMHYSWNYGSALSTVDKQTYTHPSQTLDELQVRLSTVHSLEERGLITKEEATSTRNRILARI